MSIILLILQVFLIIVIFGLFQKRSLSPILSASLLFYALLWHITPIIINTFFIQYLSNPPLVEFDVYVFYAIVETLVLFITLILLLFIPTYFCVITESKVGRVEISPRVALIIVLVSLGFNWGYNIFSLNYGSSYYDRNAFLNVAIGTPQFESIGTISFIQSLLMSFIYTCLLQKWPRRNETRLLYILVIATIAYVSFLYLLRGGRIVLLLPLVLLVLSGQSLKWSKRKILKLVAAALIITVFIGGYLAITVGQYRVQEDLRLKDLLPRPDNILKTEVKSTSLVPKMLEEVIMKFDSISWGALLVEAMGQGIARWQPYLGAFTALVPRQLMPSKPAPGSMDGTYQGIPSRLVPTMIGSESLGYNVQVSPAAIALWQFGFLGLIAMILCNVIFLLLLNSLLTCPSIITKSLAMFLIGVPSFFTLFATPDVLLLNVQRVSAVYLIFFLFLSSSHLLRLTVYKQTIPLNDLEARQ